ncbi:nuclease domain-containing protein [Domibacillus tundrae]|uniref:nuclease domain-containing protein n=1 Tax=Domibacillus tundrae TaxID=1587527 RepID=UPI000617C0C3|nr:nuclease domain-containing protein [Domibacillus tundrae]
MKIQPYMIHVDYDFNEALSNGTLPVERVQVVDKVNYDHDRECWYTFNYYRGKIQTKHGKMKNEILQTGFKLLEGDPENVSLYLASMDGSNKRELYYDENEQIWLELSRFGKKEGKYVYDSNDWVSGVVFSGTVNILIEENDNVFSEKLVFFPSGISQRDYEAMLDDLYRIRQDLISRKKTNVSVSTRSERTSQRIKEILDEIERPIRLISDNPKGELSFTWDFRKAEKPARFHPRTELEKEMNPGKEKYLTFVNHETSAIFENKLIKQELLQLKYYCDMYSSSAPLRQTDKEQKVNEMKSLFEKINRNIHRMIGKVEGADYNAVKIKVEKDISDIKEKIEKQKQKISNGLKPRATKLNKGYQEVDVTISCSISAFNLIKKECSFQPYLKTMIRSGWDKEKGEAHLAFDKYSYVLNGQTYTVNPLSYFIEIENCSDFLSDHWKFWKSLHEVIEYLEMNPSSEVNLKITGQAVWNKKHFDKLDIFGIPQEGKVNRDYKFILASISDIIVNGESIMPPADPTVMQQELARYIQDLDKVTEDLKQKQAENQINLNTVNTLAQLEVEKKNLTYEGKVIDKVIEKINELLDLPLLKEIQLGHFEPLIPTQLFLHDPNYQTIWRLLQSLEEEVGLSLLSNPAQRKIRVKKVEQLYETWCLVKVLDTLTSNLGWEFEEADTIVECINEFLGKKGKSLDRFKTSISQGAWRIDFHYEPKIYILEDGKKKYTREEPGYRTPDYYLSIYKDDFLIGHVYLDAKHKNFKEQGREALTKEIIDTSIDKYGKMIPFEMTGPTLGSFIVHSDMVTGMENETNGENYYAYYNRDEFPGSLDRADDNEAHKYGAIYLLPSALHSFKNLFRMIMEFRIGAHKKCWNCGCEEVHIEQHLTRSGYPKYYLTCPNCHEFWVKVHCSHKGHKIIKHTNNYHRQVLSDFSWYIVCPTCGDGFEIEDRIEQSKIRSSNAL